MKVQHHPDRGRFEIQMAGETAFAEYHDHGPVLVMTHTFVPPALRGKGLAGCLVQRALDFARQCGKKIDPQCSYVASYLDQHPEHADLRFNG